MYCSYPCSSVQILEVISKTENQGGPERKRLPGLRFCNGAASPLFRKGVLKQVRTNLVLWRSGVLHGIPVRTRDHASALHGVAVRTLNAIRGVRRERTALSTRPHVFKFGCLPVIIFGCFRCLWRGRHSVLYAREGRSHIPAPPCSTSLPQRPWSGGVGPHAQVRQETDARPVRAFAVIPIADERAIFRGYGGASLQSRRSYSLLTIE
jgi:hypothetical protein